MKNDYLLDALISKLLGEVKLSKANIQVYLENPVGIGEHPDVVGAIEMEITRIAEAQEKMEVAKLLMAGYVEE